MTAPPSELMSLLKQYGQEHLLAWWGELAPDRQAELSRSIQAIDFELIQRTWRGSQQTNAAVDTKCSGSRAEQAVAPRSVIYRPDTDAEQEARRADTELGRQLLESDQVAILTVAGGQGTRLGFDAPKGMFPLSPIRNQTLFEIFAAQIKARRQRHGASLPWLIMTSSATHNATVAYFRQHDFLGLAPDSVHFFQQGSMPAVDAQSGRILMSDQGTLCLSPDGHGGVVAALQSSGLLQFMADRGIEYIHYHQVDNPTVILGDPALIGVHHRHGSQLTTVVVRKRTPTEKMGALVDINERLEIIEYSELTPAQVERTDETGRSVFWAGNTAIHVFNRTFLEQLATDGCQLELHTAHKKAACIDDDGRAVVPQSPNAIKFERFIFDALPLADKALIVEGDRDREFNPVKNAEGSDSPDTARAALSRIGRAWLTAAGHSVPDTAVADISPLVALDAEELKERLANGQVSINDLIR